MSCRSGLDNTSMKALLTTTALLEATIGLALATWPSTPVAVLLGTSLDTTAALTIGRVAGAALLSLGLACWLARHDAPSQAASGLITAMLMYNVAVVAILAHTGLASGRFGLALWPGVVLHLAMAAWCVMCLRAKQASR